MMPICNLCGLWAPVLNYHHVVPQKLSKERGETILPKSGPTTVGICDLCSRGVHKIFTHLELARMSFDELKAHSKIRDYLSQRSGMKCPCLGDPCEEDSCEGTAREYFEGELDCERWCKAHDNFEEWIKFVQSAIPHKRRIRRGLTAFKRECSGELKL